MELTIQIVNFRSRHYLEGCLFSIYENLPNGLKAEVIIINNDPDKLGDLFKFEKNKIGIQTIEVNKNIGFGAGHNLGFRKARGELVLFLNPDTKVLPRSIEELTKVFKEKERIGIVGPLLINPQGHIQPECFGSKKTPLSPLRKKIFSSRDSKKTLTDVFEADWVSGGAMIVRRSLFNNLGGFDENFFMYFEDVDLCLRAKNMGLKIAVNPASRIIHDSGKSFESHQEKKRCYYASQNYYLRKHFGSFWAEIAMILRLPFYISNIYLRKS